MGIVSLPNTLTCHSMTINQTLFGLLSACCGIDTLYQTKTYGTQHTHTSRQTNRWNISFDVNHGVYYSIILNVQFFREFCLMISPPNDVNANQQGKKFHIKCWQYSWLSRDRRVGIAWLTCNR